MIKMNKKKILYINHSCFFGGSEASLLDIITHLNKDNYEPVVISPENPKLLKGLNKIGAKIVIFDKEFFPYVNICKYISDLCPSKNIFVVIYLSVKWLAKVLFNIAGGIQLLFLIRKINPDLLHANNWLSAQYIAPFIRYLKASSIFHLRDFDEKRLNRLMEPSIIKLLSKFDKAIATSQAGRQFFKKMKGFPLKKTDLIYNGIDIPFFDKAGHKLEYSRKFSKELEDDLKSHFVFIQIGQICDGKGQKYFIEAAGDVAKVMPEALFIIAGEEFKKFGESTKELMQLIKNKGLEDKVKLIGYHEDIRPILNHSDIVVCPSLEEAFGRAAAESMAMGKPVVASDIDSLREIIESGISGILVKPADYKALASAMIELAKDKNKMYRLSYNARKRIEQNFDICKRIKEIEGLYSNLIGS